MTIPTEHIVLLNQLRDRVGRLESVAAPELIWPGGSGGTVTVNCDSRCVIDENQPDTPGGGQGTFEHDLDGGDLQKVCLLTLEAPAPRIRGVYLNLDAVQATSDMGASGTFTGCRFTVTVDGVTGGFDPSTVTWNTRPDLDSFATATESNAFSRIGSGNALQWNSGSGSLKIERPTESGPAFSFEQATAGPYFGLQISIRVDFFTGGQLTNKMAQGIATIDAAQLSVNSSFIVY